MNGKLPIVYDLNDFAEYVDLNRFQYCFCAFSGNVLAVATSSCLIMSDETVSGGYRSEDTFSNGVRLVLEFNEDSGRATCIQWILEGTVVCVGFESGLLVCFNFRGEEIFEFKGHTTSVQSVKVASTDIHKQQGPALWVLYEEGLLVAGRCYVIEWFLALY